MARGSTDASGAVARLLHLERRHADLEFSEIQQRIVDEDAAGWTLFVERYSRTVYTLARSLAWRGADREEAAQQIYLGVLERLSRDRCRLLREFRGEARIETYLFTAVRNEVSHMRRKAARERSRVVPFEEQDDPRDGSGGVPPVSGSIGLDPDRVVGVVSRSLERLEPREQLVLRLRFHEGLSFRRLAEFFDWKDTNAAAYEVSRILRKLDLLRRCRESLRWSDPERRVLLDCLRRWFASADLTADEGGPR